MAANQRSKPAGFGLKRFQAFRQRHLDLEKIINHPAFSAVCRFLEQWTPEQLEGHPILSEVGTGFGVFQLVGDARPVHEVEAIRSWWKGDLPKDSADQRGQCLLTGEVAAIARLHPKIKGVQGAQSAGAPLVSFNENSYESYLNYPPYGPKGPQGKVAPIGSKAADRYGVALNELLNGPQSSKHRIRVGDTTCVFWTDKKTILEDIFAAVAASGDHAADETQDEQLRAKIHAFLNALQHGREAYGNLADDPNVTRFYLLGLSPNAARLSVRFFYQSSIHELLDHLRKHKIDIEIAREFEHPVGKRRADSEFPAYWEFLRETVRQGADPPPLLGGALMRAILEGTRYPESLLNAIVRRVRTVEKDSKTDKIIPPVNYLRVLQSKLFSLEIIKSQSLPCSIQPIPNPHISLAGSLPCLRKFRKKATANKPAATSTKPFATPTSLLLARLRPACFLGLNSYQRIIAGILIPAGKSNSTSSSRILNGRSRPTHQRRHLKISKRRVCSFSAIIISGKIFSLAKKNPATPLSQPDFDNVPKTSIKQNYEKPLRLHPSLRRARR